MIDRLARIVWDYHHLNHSLEPADCILVLGSHDLRVAERGAQLYLERWAPQLIFSGGLGNLTRGLWNEPEAEKFARVAMQMGVPRESILTETRSTNTGENVKLTRALMKQQGLDPRKFILVQKPYMERRAYATFRQFWPEKECLVTSPQIPFEQYANAEISKQEVIHIMTGDLQRIREYPSRGFQIYQEIPAEVWDAYLKLVEMGFTKNLIR